MQNIKIVYKMGPIYGALPSDRNETRLQINIKIVLLETIQTVRNDAEYSIALLDTHKHLTMVTHCTYT